MNWIGEYVVVRCTNAGVHSGILVEWDRSSVVLQDARNIWEWTEANTIQEISLHGIGKGSKVSETVKFSALEETIQVLICTPKARKSLESAKWG